MSYDVRIESGAAKALVKLPVAIRKRLIKAIDTLSEDPHYNAESLKGKKHSDLWRRRVGDYRILYQINEEKILVLVVHLGHRKDVYR